MVQDEVNVTLVNYQPTDLRLNKNYSLFYVHLVRILASPIYYDQLFIQNEKNVILNFP